MAGDRRQLVSALANLVDNAVKYSDAGSQVEVRIRAADGHIEIDVEDRGIGIPSRDLDRIFERFYRVDKARARSTGGTGLGLAIVRHVAHNHDGSVRVRVARRRRIDVHPRAPGGGDPVSIVAKAAQTILVVEDEESFVEALSLGLAREGFNVEIARDGVEALERLRSRSSPTSCCSTSCCRGCRASTCAASCASALGSRSSW